MAWKEVADQIAILRTAVETCRAALPVAVDKIDTIAEADRLAVDSWAKTTADLWDLVATLTEIAHAVDFMRAHNAAELQSMEADAIRIAPDCVYTLTRDADGYPAKKTWESKSLGKRAELTYAYAAAEKGKAVSGTSLAIEPSVGD